MSTREQILGVARDLLVAEGLSGFSMRKVARGCNLSATAIYRHFDDRGALIADAVHEGYRIFGSYLMDALQQDGPLARFRWAGLRYMDFATEHPAYYELIFMTNCEDLGLSQLDDESRRSTHGTFQFLIDRIVEAQQAEIFQPGDPTEIGIFVWSSLHGLAALELSGNLGQDDDERARLHSGQLDAVERALRA